MSKEANMAANGILRLLMKKRWEETVWKEPKLDFQYSNCDENKNKGEKVDIYITMTKVLSKQ